MCCTRLAENTGSKNHAKNRHLRTIAQLCWAISSQLRHVSTIGKKLVKWPYLLHMSLQYGEPQPSNGWDQFRSLGHPSKFQRVSRLGFVTALTSLNGGQPNFARCSAVSCTGILYVHFGGGFPVLASLLHGTRAAGVSQTLRCGTRNGITVFRRGRNLYSAGQPSRWAVARVVVILIFKFFSTCVWWELYAQYEYFKD